MGRYRVAYSYVMSRLVSALRFVQANIVSTPQSCSIYIYCGSPNDIAITFMLPKIDWSLCRLRCRVQCAALPCIAFSEQLSVASHWEALYTPKNLGRASPWLYLRLIRSRQGIGRHGSMAVDGLSVRHSSVVPTYLLASSIVIHSADASCNAITVVARLLVLSSWG